MHTIHIMVYMAKVLLISNHKMYYVCEDGCTKLPTTLRVYACVRVCVRACMRLCLCNVCVGVLAVHGWVGVCEVCTYAVPTVD